MMKSVKPLMRRNMRKLPTLLPARVGTGLLTRHHKNITCRTLLSRSAHTDEVCHAASAAAAAAAAVSKDIAE